MAVVMGDGLENDILEYPGFFTWLLAADSVKDNKDAIIRVTKDDGCGYLVEKDGGDYSIKFNSDWVPAVYNRESRTERVYSPQDGKDVMATFGNHHIHVMNHVLEELNIDSQHHDWLKSIGEVLFYRTSEL